MPLISLIPRENITPLDFQCFQGVSKEISGIKWVNPFHAIGLFDSRALARKLELMTFSRNWEIRLVFTKGPHHGWRQFFLLKPRESWKTPFWETDILEHDIIQHTQITTEKCFFLYLSKTWLGYGLEINKHIDFSQIKVINNMSKNNIARYIPSQIMFQQQDRVNTTILLK